MQHAEARLHHHGLATQQQATHRLTEKQGEGGEKWMLESRSRGGERLRTRGWNPLNLGCYFASIQISPLFPLDSVVLLPLRPRRPACGRRPWCARTAAPPHSAAAPRAAHCRPWPQSQTRSTRGPRQWGLVGHKKSRRRQGRKGGVRGGRKGITYFPLEYRRMRVFRSSLLPCCRSWSHSHSLYASPMATASPSTLSASRDPLGRW